MVYKSKGETEPTVISAVPDKPPEVEPLKVEKPPVAPVEGYVGKGEIDPIIRTALPE